MNSLIVLFTAIGILTNTPGATEISNGLFTNYIEIQEDIDKSREETEEKLNKDMEIKCFDEYIEKELKENEAALFDEKFKETLITKCMETQISPWLVISIIKHETHFNPDARAYDGSAHYGLFQLSQFYFQDEINLTETKDIFEPNANITVGIDNLHSIQEKIKYYSCLQNTSIEHPMETLTVMAHNKGLGDAVPLFQAGTVNAFAKEVISDYVRMEKTYGTIDCAKVLTGSSLGFWIERSNGTHVCSDCNETVEVAYINGIPVYKYCPYCGKEKNLDYKEK